MATLFRGWGMQAIASMEPGKMVHSPLVSYLRSPQAIRDRCGVLFDLACQDRLAHFRCDLSQLEPTANYVLQVIRENYPDLNVPFHSRWRHFQAGGCDRLSQLQQRFSGLSSLEVARAKYDLAVTSVLLDAGAGAAWRYTEADTGMTLSRSEGLAIASFHLFFQGGFSSDPTHPFRADAIGLETFSETRFSEGFQLSEQNPLVGVSGRVGLMQRLGKTLRRSPHFFGTDLPRPGHLVDYLLTQAEENSLPAPTVLTAVLEGFSDIWGDRLTLDGENLGDVWQHSALPDTGAGSQLVPFHKLSQWLTYSLLEPLQELGLQITHLDALTGLAEYRNGGLCLDLGLLQPKHDGVTGDRHLPGSEIIVEWRALTVILLDQIAATLRHSLNCSAAELPLVKVLEGGTWAAGRKIASDRRPGGVPPIQIESDGTVF